MTRVKICGITNLEDALYAVDCGADELGVNFYRGSKRYIEPQVARKIAIALPKTTNLVGVFVNEPINDVIEISNLVGLDGIQLHGDEDFRYVDRVVLEKCAFVIKALRVSAGFVIEDAMDWTADQILLDGDSSGEYGGTGTRFDWEIAKDFSLLFPRYLYLAGGLTPTNVADAIGIVRPFAVDVASGVESSPGKKDPRKVEAFLEAVRRTAVS